MTQITNMLKRGDRKRTLQQFMQTKSAHDPDENPFDQPATVGKNLQVMVSASDRLVQTAFQGVNLSDRQGKSARRVRPGKQHLKFPLYLDEQVGLSELKNLTQSLHDASADEDYETDAEIMRKTVLTCKRDVLFALKKMQAEPTTYHKTLRNHKYQRYFKKD